MKAEVVKEGWASLFSMSTTTPLAAILLDKDSVVIQSVEPTVQTTGVGLVILVPFPVKEYVYTVDRIVIAADQPLILVTEVNLVITPGNPDYTISIPVSL